MDFIINSEDSVLKYWLNEGISGWRLDVIDELPVPFLRQFYHTLKEEKPDAVLIGESGKMRRIRSATANSGNTSAATISTVP